MSPTSIKMKIAIVKMMEVVEEAMKQFNVKQHETRYIRKMFLSVGQDK